MPVAKDVFQDRLADLRKRLRQHEEHHAWLDCIKLQARINETEHIWLELLRIGVIKED